MKSQASKPESPLLVSVVQMNSGLSIEANLASITRFASTAARAGSAAVLFPECATTGYARDFRKLRPAEIRGCLNSLSDLASRLRVNLLVGSPVFLGRRLFNALLVFDRDGHLVHAYSKCQLTEGDRRWFTPGDSPSLFKIDGIAATSIICHERRYPELVRLPVMAGARIVFHPNAGLDSLQVSRSKRKGRDGIAVRAFENAVPYVFANTVGPQGNGCWSAGDSKIVSARGDVIKLAGNSKEQLLTAALDMSQASGKYAADSLCHPRILARHWPSVIRDIRRATAATDRRFQRLFRTCRPAMSVQP